MTGSAWCGDLAWHSWDGSPEGRAPSVVLDDASSSEFQSLWRVTVHGFHIETLEVNGETFHRVIVPDPDFADLFALTGDTVHNLDATAAPALSGFHEIGRPELPFHASFIGIVSDGDPLLDSAIAEDPAARRPGEGEPFVIIDAVDGVPPRCLPAQESTLDCGDADPPPFLIDQRFYDATDAFYPEAIAEMGEMEWWMSVGGVRVQVNVAQYNPLQRVLRVAKQIAVKVAHAGNLLPLEDRPDIKATLEPLYKRAIRNFERIKGVFRALLGADMLVIAHRDFESTIDPLIASKTAQGFTVAKLVVHAAPADGEIPATTPAIRLVIQAAWATARLARRDLAVLLVGDTDRVPTDSYTDLHPMIGMFSTDKPYACIVGADNIPDIPVARLSADSVAQLADQVVKIVRYEDNAPAGDWARKALLTSHQQGNQVYTRNQCWTNRIVTLSPTGFPTYAPGAATAWLLCDTSGALAGNNFVETTINAGVGVVGYRGHGLSDRWHGWSGLAQPVNDWRDVEVDACDLQNDCRTPAVFAICCLNGSFAGVDGIGEHWMQAGPKKGAVSHYGSVPPSRTLVNNRLNNVIFGALYLLAATDYGSLALFGERTISLTDGVRGQHTAMAYNLLGDPRMQIRITPAPAPAAPACCTGDLNGDGMVDVLDLGLLLASWGAPLCDPAFDMDANGVIGAGDLGMLLGAWGPC